MTVSDPLASLNEAQRHAVEVPAGALLILAGPGSGKTRVIAHRIAYLVQAQRVPPWRIMAVTFTNKAAAEMRERVEALLGPPARDLMMGTFHSICARVLRRDGEAIGLPRDYVIYNTDDQLALVKRIEGNLHIDPKRHTPRSVLSGISTAKNERLGAAAVLAQANTYHEEIVGRVYEQYERALARNSAVDFDDLLGRVLELFEKVPSVRDRYAERYQHVLIDEFQDTNLVQYGLASEFASHHRNITAVGDPDQSIYSWRAADIRNLQYFERDFPGTEVVLLEQNYRSTGHILRAAHALIAKGADRRERELWTDNPDGAPVVVKEVWDGDEEGVFVGGEIRRQIAEAGRRPGDFAVMYRTNAQSRSIEEALIERGIRYRIVGGTRFYDRREIRDLLAYLRLVQNHADSVAFDRIVNVPARGIGTRSVQEIAASAAEQDVSPFVVAGQLAAGTGGPRLRPQVRAQLVGFVDLIDRLGAMREQVGVADLLDTILSETRYRAHLEHVDPEGMESRWENVQELRTVASQYEDIEAGASLATFLEEVALVADVEDPGADVPDAVTLTTLHAAKGLEYPVVFMPGMEEGLLPHLRALDDPLQMEEERRVCYVGMTRARERLYFSHAARRFHFGATRNNPPSRFISDLPAASVESISGNARRSHASGRERRAAFARKQVERVEPQPDIPTYTAGERVAHAKFGIGRVVSCEPAGTDQRVTVAFEEQGLKRLLASLAPLERMGQ